MSTRTDNFQHESSAHERLTRPKTTVTDQSARGSLAELYPVEVVTAWDGMTVIWRTIPTTSPASLKDYNSTLLCYNWRPPTTAVQRAILRYLARDVLPMPPSRHDSLPRTPWSGPSCTPRRLPRWPEDEAPQHSSSSEDAASWRHSQHIHSHTLTMSSTMTAVVPAVCTGRQWRSVRAAANAKFSDAHLPSWLLDGCTKINPISAKNKWLQLLGNITDTGDENKPEGWPQWGTLLAVDVKLFSALSPPREFHETRRGFQKRAPLSIIRLLSHVPSFARPAAYRRGEAHLGFWKVSRTTKNADQTVVYAQRSAMDRNTTAAISLFVTSS